VSAPVNEIEIYAPVPATTLLAWLQTRFADVHCIKAARRAGHPTQQLLLTGGVAGGEPVRVLIVEAVSGTFSSLCFEPASAGGTLPWRNDAACARDVHQQLGCEVRFCNGGWRDGQPDAEAWVVIDADGERLMAWPDP